MVWLAPTRYDIILVSNPSQVGEGVSLSIGMQLVYDLSHHWNRSSNGACSLTSSRSLDAAAQVDGAETWVDSNMLAGATGALIVCQCLRDRCRERVIYYQLIVQCCQTCNALYFLLRQPSHAIARNMSSQPNGAVNRQNFYARQIKSHRLVVIQFVVHFLAQRLVGTIRQQVILLLRWQITQTEEKVLRSEASDETCRYDYLPA